MPRNSNWENRSPPSFDRRALQNTGWLRRRIIAVLKQIKYWYQHHRIFNEIFFYDCVFFFIGVSCRLSFQFLHWSMIGQGWSMFGQPTTNFTFMVHFFKSISCLLHDFYYSFWWWIMKKKDLNFSIFIQIPNEIHSFFHIKLSNEMWSTLGHPTLLHTVHRPNVGPLSDIFSTGYLTL